MAKRINSGRGGMEFVRGVKVILRQFLFFLEMRAENVMKGNVLGILFLVCTYIFVILML